MNGGWVDEVDEASKSCRKVEMLLQNRSTYPLWFQNTAGPS